MVGLVLVLAACGSAHSSGPGQHSAAAGGGSSSTRSSGAAGLGSGAGEANVAAWECPAAVDQPCSDASGLYPFAQWYSSDEFAEDLRFKAVEEGGVVALAEQTVGGVIEPVLLMSQFALAGFSPSSDQAPAARVLRLTEPPEVSTSALGFTAFWTWLGPDGHPTSVSGSFFGYHAIVLGCAQQSCRLYGLAAEDAELEQYEFGPIEGGEVPLSDVRGLVRWGATEQDVTVGVFGDGIATFDGSEWTVVIAPGEGTPINAMAWCTDSVADLSGTSEHGVSRVVAVGEHGRMLVRTDGDFVEVETNVQEDLLSVAVVPNSMFAAAGRNGTLLFGNDKILVRCSLTDEDLPLVRARQNGWDTDLGMTPDVTAFTATGSVIDLLWDRAARQQCQTKPALDAAPLDGADWLGTDVGGGVVVTADGLYGRFEGVYRI